MRAPWTNYSHMATACGRLRNHIGHIHLLDGQQAVERNHVVIFNTHTVRPLTPQLKRTQSKYDRVKWRISIEHGQTRHPWAIIRPIQRAPTFCSFSPQWKLTAVCERAISGEQTDRLVRIIFHDVDWAGTRQPDIADSRETSKQSPGGSIRNQFEETDQQQRQLVVRSSTNRQQVAAEVEKQRRGNLLHRPRLFTARSSNYDNVIADSLVIDTSTVGMATTGIR